MDHQPSQQNHSPNQSSSTRFNASTQSPSESINESIEPDFAGVSLTEPLPTEELPRKQSSSPVLQPRARTTSVPSSTALVTKKRSTPSQQCPSCGAMQPTSTSICMACGTFLPAKSQNIRCRRCGTQASANLHLCPGCGRELEAGTPRSLSWIVPMVLVVLFLLAMQQIIGSNTLTWSRAQLTTGWQWVTAIGERLDPQITIRTVPVEVSVVAAEPLVETLGDVNTLARLVTEPLATINSDSTTGNDAQAASEQNLNAQTTIISSTVTSADFTGEGATATVLKNAPIQLAIEPSPTDLLAATATERPIETPTEMPTETVEPTATATATPSATPSATMAPSPTVTPQREAATAVLRSEAKSGEPLVQIDGTATPVEALVATDRPSPVSEVTSPSITATPKSAAAQPAADQPVIASILQPTATALPSATAAPTATPAPTVTPVPPTATATAIITTYKVQAGDTPLAIAGRFDIGLDELFAANGLSAADARRLRVGQELIIPVLGQATQPAATPTATATSPTDAATATATTAVVATATTAPTTAPAPDSAIRIDAPELRSPENGSSLSCGSSNSLIWLPVSFMREGDRYLLHLGFLNGYNTDGSESIVWVLEQLQPANATIWTMDEGLCGLSPQNFGRQWRWYVEVVEPTATAKTPVSLPSVIWGFSWN